MEAANTGLSAETVPPSYPECGYGFPYIFASYHVALCRR